MEVLSSFFLNNISPMVSIGAQLTFIFILIFVIFFPLITLTYWIEQVIYYRFSGIRGAGHSLYNIIFPMKIITKLLQKESQTDPYIDRPLFCLAPYVGFSTVVLTLIVLPFSSHYVLSHSDLGVLYLITFIFLMGIHALIGAVRSLTQSLCGITLYGFVIMIITLQTHSLSIQDIIQMQGPHPWQWLLFLSPFTLAAFLLSLSSLMIIIDQPPYGTATSSSEIHSGYKGHYTGIRYFVLTISNKGAFFILSAMTTHLFLGGWQAPASWLYWAAVFSPQFPNIIEMGVFLFKTLCVVWIILILQNTLPPLRLDHLIKLTWKYLIPLGLTALAGTAIWTYIFPDGNLFTQYLLSLLLVTFGIYFFYRLLYHTYLSIKPRIKGKKA